jgi:hypothetical protein
MSRNGAAVSIMSLLSFALASGLGTAMAATTTYNLPGVVCEPVNTSNDGDFLTLDPPPGAGITASFDQNHVFNPPSSAHVQGAAWVVCPIFKTTSADGLSNDSISSVKVHFTQNASASARCRLTDYLSRLGSNGSNWVASNASTKSGTNFTISLATGSSNYWNANGKAGTDGWMYAELFCEIGPGADLKSYDVIENGTTQTGKSIVSSAWCQANPDLFDYFPNTTSGTQGGPLGYLEGIGDADGFIVDCPPPYSSATVEIAVGPPINGDFFGCENGSVMQWTSAGPEFVSQYLTIPNNGTLSCWTASGSSSGDPKIWSVRTF